MVPFETGFQDSAEEKLVHRVKQAVYNTHLITIEIGSQEVPKYTWHFSAA